MLAEAPAPVESASNDYSPAVGHMPTQRQSDAYMQWWEFNNPRCKLLHSIFRDKPNLILKTNDPALPSIQMLWTKNDDLGAEFKSIYKTSQGTGANTIIVLSTFRPQLESKSDWLRQKEANDLETKGREPDTQ